MNTSIVPHREPLPQTNPWPLPNIGFRHRIQWPTISWREPSSTALVRAPTRPGNGKFEDRVPPSDAQQKRRIYSAFLTLLKWLPYVNSYLESQKRIVNLRALCVERGIELKVERIKKANHELYLDGISSMKFALRQNPNYRFDRAEAERIFGKKWQIAQRRFANLDTHREYLQSIYDLMRDENVLKAELINPTIWC